MKSTFIVDTDKKTEILAPLNEYGAKIEKFDETINKRWISNLGFTQAEAMLVEVKRGYSDAFNQEVLQSAEQYLDRSLELIADVPAATLVFKHVNFLHNRIGILQSDWMSLRSIPTIDAVEQLDYSLTIPDVKNTSSTKLASFMSTNYLKYLNWQTNKDQVEKMIARDQRRLHALVVNKNIGTAWISELIEQDSDIPEYNLARLTKGFAVVSNQENVTLDLAYTKQGRDKLLAIIDDIETFEQSMRTSEEYKTVSVSSKASSIVNSNTTIYENYLDNYTKAYIRAWREYLQYYGNGFHKLDSLDAAAFMETMLANDSPYDRLFSRAYSELNPIRDLMLLNGEKTPLWMQNVLTIATMINISKVLEKSTISVNSTSVVSQVKTLANKVGTFATGFSIENRDEKLKASANYRHYAKSLGAIVEQALKPSESYKLLSAYLENSKLPDSERSNAVHTLFSASDSVVAKTGGHGGQIAANLLRAQVLDIVHILVGQASKHIQTVWAKEYNNQFDRDVDPVEKLALFKKSSKFWKFYQDISRVMLSRSRSGTYTSLSVFDQEVQFTPKYLSTLRLGDTISMMDSPTTEVGFAAIPTGVNVGSKAVPTETRLKIICGKKEFELVNNNYPVRETLEFNVLECTEVSIEVLVGSLKLIKRYSGDWCYFDFWRDFRQGQRKIYPKELEVSGGRLRDYNITDITIGYKISHNSKLDILAKLRNITVPKNIIASTHIIQKGR